MHNDRFKTQTAHHRAKVTPAKLRSRLEHKLLVIGGKSVIWQGCDPHAALIAAKGVEFRQQPTNRRGEQHECHRNAGELWASGENACRLVTGYALSKDRWVSHSWTVDDKTLYETTYQYDRYFGVELAPLVAFRFWLENACPGFGDKGPLPAMDYFTNRPAAMAGFDLMAELGREECMRRLVAYDEGREP